MVDFSSYKVPIFPNINDVPTAPTATEGQNISYMNERLNTFITALETTISEIQDDLSDLFDRVTALEAVNTITYTTTVNLTSTSIDLFTITENATLTKILVENATDIYLVYPSLTSI